MMNDSGDAVAPRGTRQWTDGLLSQPHLLTHLLSLPLGAAAAAAAAAAHPKQQPGLGLYPYPYPGAAASSLSSSSSAANSNNSSCHMFACAPAGSVQQPLQQQQQFPGEAPGGGRLGELDLMWAMDFVSSIRYPGDPISSCRVTTQSTIPEVRTRTIFSE
jgi:hypothetical protein